MTNPDSVKEDKLVSILRHATRDEAENAPLVLTSSQRVGAVQDHSLHEDLETKLTPITSLKLIDDIANTIHEQYLAPAQDEPEEPSQSEHAPIDPSVKSAIEQAVREELSKSLGRLVKEELRKSVQKEVARHMALLSRMER